MKKYLRVLGSVIILSVLAWRTDWRQVTETFRHLRVGYWAMAVGLYIATQAVSSVRWQMLARPLGFHRPVSDYFRFYFIGMFWNLCLPTSVGGDVVRGFYLDGGSGHKAAAYVSVFVDRLSGLLVLLAMACIAAAVCPLDLPAWLTWSVWGTAGGALCGLFSAALLARSASEGTLPALALRARKTKLAALSGKLARSLPLALRPGPLLLSVFVQAANVVLVWLVGVAIDAPVPAAFYWILVPMVSLMTLAPITFNGMGVREWGTVLLLAPLGVATGTAVSLAFLWFAVFSTASLFGAGFYLWGGTPRFEVRDDESLSCDPDQGRTRQLRTAA